MVYIFAVGLKGRMYFFLTKMQGISPADIPILHEQYVGILTIIFLLKQAIIKTRIDHQNNISQIK